MSEATTSEAPDEDVPGGDLVPENVSEEEAEAYLQASGWTKLSDDVGWAHALYPLRTKAGKLVGKTRGRAVVLQYQSDWKRLMFVLGRGKMAHVKMLHARSMSIVVEDLVEAYAKSVERSGR